MKRDSRESFCGLRLVPVFVAVLGLLFMPSPVSAETSSFAEDFTTTTFMDALQTNVTGWGSGSVQLPSEEPTLEGTYSFPGVVVDIAVEGEYMYVTDGSFRVLNIADPVHPTPLGSVSVSGFISVEGDLAYVSEATKSTIGSTLRVVNLTDPTNPTLLPNGASGGGHLSVSGNYAYCASGTAGLRIVNITDPTNPALVSTLPIVASGFDSVCVSGDYAYVAEDFYVRVVDVSDPVHPAIIASTPTDGNSRAIATFGMYVFVAGDAESLDVKDVSDPHNPRAVGGLYLTERIYDFQIDGHYAYLATWLKKLVVIDVSNPLEIFQVESWGEGDSDVVCVSGGYAYVVNNMSGDVSIVAISDPVPPALLGVYVTKSAIVWDVFVSGSYAYVATGIQLTIVNVTDPGSPQYVGNVTTWGWCQDVYVSGHLAYVACGTSGFFGLQVVNISDSASPFITGSCSTGANGLGVHVDGDYAYMADGSAGLRVFDITDPSLPSLVATCPTGGLAYSVFVHGDCAYVATGEGGLATVNITDPSAPELLCVYDTPGSAEGVFVRGDRAYVADGSSGLVILNISDPLRTTYLGTHTTYNLARGIDVSGGLAYVGQYVGPHPWGYLDVVNVTDPANPTLLARDGLNTNNIFGLCVEGDYVYVANYGYGLTIAEVGRNRYRQFETLAVAQSTTVFTGSASSLLSYATLTWTGTEPSGSEITFYLSPDNGLHWEEVLSGVRHDFVNSGRQLVWKSVLTSAAHLATPVLSQLSISFAALLNPPLLLTPGNDTSTIDDTPTFEWSAMSDATGYLLQIDRTPSFDSVDLLNVTVTGATNHTLVAPLSDGTWYWRVAANDSSGDLGEFSSTWQMTIDTSAPTFDEAPADRTTEFGATFRYDLNASDPSDLDMWCLNDTAHFSVDDSGVVTSLDVLPMGVYGLEVAVNDTFGHTLVATFTVVVQDTLPPAWVEVPENQTVELGTTLSYDLNASDPSGLDTWWLNDTAHFDVDDSGVVTSLGVLSVGSYGLQVWVNDTIGHICTALFTVVVQDTTPPVWVEVPENQTVEFGTWVRYDLNATDLSGSLVWWVNDTLHFEIDAGGVIVNVTFLPVRAWGLEVRVRDNSNCYTIAVFEVDVRDTTPPTWVAVPLGEAVEFGEHLTLAFYVYDLSSFSRISVNDTLHFDTNVIYDAAGFHFVVLDNVLLQVGKYGLVVRIYDIYDNYCETTTTVAVEDTTPPSWLVTPTNRTLSYGDALTYQLETFDLSGVASWQTNDTEHFTVSSSGHLTNAMLLSPGVYGITVTASDPYDNVLTGVFAVTVTGTTGGVDMVLVALAISGGGFAVVVVIVILFRWSKSPLRRN